MFLKLLALIVEIKSFVFILFCCKCTESLDSPTVQRSSVERKDFVHSLFIFLGMAKHGVYKYQDRGRQTRKLYSVCLCDVTF